MKSNWNGSELEFEMLNGPTPADFVCPRREQTSFFTDRAWYDQLQNLSVTYVLKVNGTLAGFISLTMDAIPLASTERPQGVYFSKLPALKIAQMGVHQDKGGKGLGRYLVSLALVIAHELSTKVGCRYMTLDSKEDLVDWYEKQGFVRNEFDNLERQKRLENTQMPPKKRLIKLARLPVSMRFDLNRISAP